MAKILGVFFAAFFVVFALDQAVKQIFLGGFSWQGEYFSLVLAYNRGVAFSMFAFLGEWLKFIQLALIAGVCGYLLWRLKRKRRKKGNFRGARARSGYNPGRW